MSELTFNLLRFGYLLLLWVFVLSAVAVLRRDIAIRGRATGAAQFATAGQATSTHQAGAGPVVSEPGPSPLPPPGPAPIVVGPGAPATSGGSAIPPGPALPGGPALPVGNAGPVIAIPGHSATSAPVPIPAPVVPKHLAITTGALAGSVLPLSSQPITIGRAAGNTLVIEDDYASSHHARLYPEPDGWVIEDLGSTNGTFIDGAPLKGAVLLPVGVPVTIGHSTFKLVV